MRNFTISLMIVLSAISSIFAQEANSLVQYRYEQMNNPVIEEGITTNSEDDVIVGNTVYMGTATITGDKAAKVCTLYIAAPKHEEVEVKPLISAKEIEEINAKAEAYHQKRIASIKKVPATLWDSCLTAANSYFPNDPKAAKRYAKETYKIVKIYSNSEALAEHQRKEDEARNKAYSQATRIEIIRHN